MTVQGIERIHRRIPAAPVHAHVNVELVVGGVGNEVGVVRRARGVGGRVVRTRVLAVVGVIEAHIALVSRERSGRCTLPSGRRSRGRIGVDLLAIGDHVISAGDDGGCVAGVRVAHAQSDLQRIGDQRLRLEIKALAGRLTEIRGEPFRAGRNLHDLLNVGPLDVEGAHLHLETAIEETILGANLVAPERVAFVGRRRGHSDNRALPGPRCKPGSYRSGGLTPPMRSPFGGTHIQKIVVIQLNIDAELGIDDSLLFLPEN